MKFLLQERAIRKKLQQIEALEQKAQSEQLDSQQQAKVSSKPVLLAALQALEVGQDDQRLALTFCSFPDEQYATLLVKSTLSRSIFFNRKKHFNRIPAK